MSPDYPSETRKDCITREWVACAPDRSDRPQQTSTSIPKPGPTDDTPVDGCPFCPGNEDQLPAVLWEIEATDGDQAWRTRAVPNKYSALTCSPDAVDDTPNLYRTRPSLGRQEVIIDTPYHEQRLSQMPEEQVDAILRTYLARYEDQRQDSLFPFVFRNHGASAGASIPHPHSQIIGTDFAPPRIEEEEAAAKDRHDETGRCPYCEMISRELREEERIVYTTEYFVAFVPYAARVPYEMWVLPRDHEPEFGNLAPAAREDLADVLKTMVVRLERALHNPDYNFFIRTAIDYNSEAPHLHWSLRLQPRTSVQAGFELSTGIRINPSIPERDAKVLRSAGNSSA